MSNANFTPVLKGYTGQGAFRFWCQTVLPIVYDDSLSYYELLNKVVEYLNNTISDVSNVETNVDDLLTAYISLQEYVNNYFSSLDISTEINNKLDEMAIDGSLTNLISPLIPNAVSDWLTNNITPTTPVVDSSLSVSGAAADSKTVGDKAVLQRNALVSGDDLNNIIVSGTYYKIYSNNVLNAPKNSTQARLLVLASVGGSYAVVQIWHDCTDNELYYRTKATSGDSFTDWVKIVNANELNAIGMLNRGFLTNTDLNSIFTSGWWYVRNSDVNTLVNYPSIAGGRFIVFTTSGVDGNCVQILFTTQIEQGIYVRETDGVGSWGAWICIATGTYEKEITVHHIPRNETTGYLAGGMGSAAIHQSPNGMIDVLGAKKVTIEVPSDCFDANTSITIFYFNKDYTLSRTYTDTNRIVDITMRNNETMFIPLIKNAIKNNFNIKVIAEGCQNIKIKKLFKRTVTEADKFIHFGYPISDNLYNTGRIMLPYNYTPDGDSCPVILFVHGSNCYLTANGDMLSDYVPFWEYLCNQGYAIIDCWGWTSKYSQSGNNQHNPWMIPTTKLAYNSLVDFVINNFNIDKNNMFIMCKSLGGYIATYLLSTGRFKAGSLLAPALAYFGGNQYASFGYTSAIRQIIANELQLTGNTSGYISGSYTAEEGKDFWRQNLDKLSGYMPTWMGLTGNSASDKLETDMSRVYNVHNLCKTGMPPTIIFAAMDDESVDVNVIQSMCENIRNAGQVGTFRVMPNGTGGHHSVDSDANALKNANPITTRSGVVYAANTVPLAYVESEEFISSFCTNITK